MSFDEQPDGDPHGECTAEIHRLESEVERLQKRIEIISKAAPDPGTLRNMLRAIQNGEMTVSRGVELVDMWLAGNYSDDMLPPVREGLGEDEMPWDRIDALTEEVAELRKDAERYRWLRAQHQGVETKVDAEWFEYTEPTEHAWCVFRPGTDCQVEPVGCIPGELDAAIDAALAKEQP